LKTHDLAAAMQQLARMLKAGPNLELSELVLTAPTDKVTQGDIVVGLTTLVQLAKIDKQQWLSMIRQHGFPIEVRAADASRDVLGKLLKYLDKNPDALKKLKENARSSSSSPQLMRALDALLRDDA
jgi:hypothetical protein